MERLVILCCWLLSAASISSGTLCISNTECPHNQTWCVQNCSAVAIEEFNLTASHGNCKASSTIGGSDSDITYGCHIGPCSSDLCVASSIEDTTNETACCCTEDFCNAKFTVSPTTPTYCHIYPTFPSHTTPDQLVCEYYNCTDDAHCVRGYEVCDENPLLDGYDDALVCIALFDRNSSEKEGLFKGCFVDQYDPGNENCVMEEYPTNFYSCHCNSTLCNNNGSLITPSNHTCTIAPTGTTEPVSPTNNVYIYSTYPQHTTPDQLVCEYYNCTGTYCVRGYEVCDENPLFKDFDHNMFVCIADVYHNSSKMEVYFKSCFVDEFDPCKEKCVLRELEFYTDWYTCCCKGPLCNNDGNLILPSHHTSTNSPTSNSLNSLYLTPTTSTSDDRATYTLYLTPTTSTSDDSKSNYIPLIYGVTAGVCLLIVLTLVVIVILAYCRTRTARHAQSVSYNKLINS